MQKREQLRYEHYVYRYTDKRTGDVVYIGKTNRSLKARVNAHKREEAFAPYDCDIDCVKLSNEVETDSVEKFLINYYKPVINLKDKIPFLTKEISLDGLDWIPYDAYLISLKILSQRKELLKKDALLKVYLVDTICESDGKEIVFPNIVSTLPCIDGLFEFANQNVVKKEDGYHYILLPDVKNYIEENYNKVLAAIWMPTIAISNISDHYLEEFSACDYGFEIVDLLKDFAYNCCRSEYYFEPFVATIPKKYGIAMKYVEPYTSDIREFGDFICFEWTYDHEEYLPFVLESICKDLIKLARMDGIWDYGD